MKARELRDADDAGWRQALDEDGSGHQDIETEACFKYVTLLNLRNWAQLPDGSVVTEQVYVHTKLMIVDDLYALLGSANVNDRSLLGMRDSEIAVLVEDGRTARADINGTGSQRPVRLFAHELSKQIWKKLFGITGNVRPATELTQAIDQPGSPDSWKLIQRRAATNAELYEAAFAFVPRNVAQFEGGEPEAAKILPTWKDDKGLPARGSLTAELPYRKKFWDVKQTIPARAVSSLQSIKGFITALPVNWTVGENLRIPYPTSLIVRNERNTPGGGDGPAFAQLERSSTNGAREARGQS